MGVVNVGNLLSVVPNFVIVSEFTLEKGFMNVGDAGSLIPIEITFLHT